MKRQLNRGAYRRGFTAAKQHPPRRSCPYPAGSVAAASWNHGAMEHDIALPLIRDTLAKIEDLYAKAEASSDSARRMAEEAYESEERHVRKIAALNGKLRESEAREHEAQQQRDFVLDTARLLERAHEQADDVEIDHLIAKLKAGW